MQPAPARSSGQTSAPGSSRVWLAQRRGSGQQNERQLFPGLARNPSFRFRPRSADRLHHIGLTVCCPFPRTWMTLKWDVSPKMMMKSLLLTASCLLRNATKATLPCRQRVKRRGGPTGVPSIRPSDHSTDCPLGCVRRDPDRQRDATVADALEFALGTRVGRTSPTRNTQPRRQIGPPATRGILSSAPQRKVAIRQDSTVK